MDWHSLSVNELIRKTKCQPDKGLSDKKQRNSCRNMAIMNCSRKKGPVSPPALSHNLKIS